MFGLMCFPAAYQCFISYFAFTTPLWKCKENSTTCLLNGTHPTTDKRICLYQPTEWEYTESRAFSIVSQFDLYCDKEWLIEMTTSTLFIGWFFGSILIGWWSDNYGRRKAIFVSIASTIFFGLLSSVMPNIYSFIACRFFIGCFLPGTFQQIMFLYISEIVGDDRRAFAGLSMFFFVNISLLVLALKAYFIRQWRLLYIVSTVPFAFVVGFYRYVPESVRFLRVQGKTDEAMSIFRMIADRNRTEIPDGVSIEPHAMTTKTNSSTPLDLFRTPKLCVVSIIQAVTYFAGAMSFYSLYLGAANISGNMFRDYLFITAIEVPVAIMMMDFTERFGRKRTVMATMFIGSLMCVPLGFIPNRGDMKIARLIFGMIGKVSISAHCNCIQSWSVELYPTKIRGVAMGFLLLVARLGAASAAFVNKEFSKCHEGGVYIFIGATLFILLFMLCFLPEMKGVPISDGDSMEESESSSLAEEC